MSGFRIMAKRSRRSRLDSNWLRRVPRSGPIQQLPNAPGWPATWKFEMVIGRLASRKGAVFTNPLVQIVLSACRRLAKITFRYVRLMPLAALAALTIQAAAGLRTRSVCPLRRLSSLTRYRFLRIWNLKPGSSYCFSTTYTLRFMGRIPR